MKQHTYIAIDLKSFYASVECRERGLDPLDTNLVVADESRTDKTICLAVTPSLKSYGISGRGRLFEVKQRVKEANAGRQHDAPGHRLDGTSHFFSELQANPSLAIDFIIAPPRMAYYMEYSTRIYQVYLKYIAPEDIVVYSIDEVFMDVTDYLNTYKLSAHDLAMKIILDVLETTGITATAGIGTNLFLCKVAMDIVAKHIPADKNGVRIAELDEMKFRRELWTHQPLTDFWRVGRGIAKKLEQNGMFTMGDVALCSERNEDLLYKLFGKNAELLIDHAWGWEPTTIEAIKAYRPSSNSLSSGQVLHCPYCFHKSQNFIQNQHITLFRDQYFSCKIECIFEIFDLFCFFGIRKIFKCLFCLLKTEQFNLRLQTLHKTNCFCISFLHELYNDNASPLTCFLYPLSDRCGGFPLSLATVNMYRTFIHYAPR